MLQWIGSFFTRTKNSITSAVFRFLYKILQLLRIVPSDLVQNNTNYQIYRAVRNGDLAKIKEVLTNVSTSSLSSATLNFQGFKNLNALNIAVAMGHLHLVKYFVEERGVSTSNKSLQVATEYGKVKIVEYLVERGEDLYNIKPSKEQALDSTPLSIFETAVLHGRVNIVNYIVRRTADKKLLTVRDAVLAIKKPNVLIDTILSGYVSTNEVVDFSEHKYTPEQQRRFLYYIYFKMRRHMVELVTQTHTSLVDITGIDDDSDSLMHYCALNAPSMIGYLIELLGADCRLYNAHGLRPIHIAIAFNATGAVRAMLKAGEDPNIIALRDDEYTPLIMACTSNPMIVRVLLDNGADPNIRGKDGLAPIHYASKVGHYAIIESLLLAGVDINGLANGFTPLHYAIQQNNLESVLTLLRKGADRMIRTPKKQTALELAVACKTHQTIIKLLSGELPLPPKLTLSERDNFVSLINQGELAKIEQLMNENVEYVVARAKTDQAGIFVASITNLETVKLFIKHGASPITLTTLRPVYAAAINNFEVFDYLADNGGHDLERIQAYDDENPMTSLDFASIMGVVEGITASHRKGIKPTKIGILERMNVLHSACTEGKSDSVAKLLELYCPNDLDINAIGYAGNTALHIAAEYGKLPCVVQLLHHGADCTIKNRQGYTALELALDAEHADIVQVIQLYMNGTPTPPLTDKEKEDYIYMVTQGLEKKILDVIKENPQYLWVESKQINKIFHHACEVGAQTIIEELLPLCKPHISASTDITPCIVLAANAKHNEIVDILCVSDFDRDAQENSSDYTALHLACRQGNHLLANIIFSHGFCDLNIAGSSGKRPIHLATETGDCRMLEMLLEAGVDVNSRIDNRYKWDNKSRGYTPLHIAIENGDYETVVFLIRKGADVTMKTWGPLRFYEEEKPSVEMTCLELANKSGNKIIEKVIEQVTLFHEGGLGDTESQISVFHKMKNMMTGGNSDKELTKQEQLQFILPEDLDLETKRLFLLELLSFRDPAHRTQQAVQAFAQSVMKTPQFVSARDMTNNDTVLHMASCLPAFFTNLLLECGASYHLRNKRMEKPIHTAAQLGNNEVIQIFLDKGEDVDTTIEDETAFTPLMVAIKYGQVHTVEFLINQCNANIVNENGSGFSAIHIAAERNLPEIIRMIVAKGESVDRIMRGSHLTPLHLAVGTRSVSSLITLLALGANPFAKSLPFCGAKTALDTAKDMLQYGFKCVPKMIEILETAQTHPENLPVPLTATQIALCFDMIQQGLTEAALTLLEENIEYAFSVDVVPLLLHAANMNNTVIVRKLLEIGVDAYIESPDGITAMHNAANCPTTEMIDILVEAYPDIIHISQFNLDMGSPMHVAVKMKKMHNIEALLKHGVSPMFLYDKNGWTPIHAACEMGEFEIVKLLIDGPKEKPTPEVNRFILLRSPAKLAYYGYLPIHSAIVSGHANIARYLCEQGSPVLFPLNDYFNLYELALDFQDEKMMSLVMEFLNKEISDHFDKMQNKQELCDIDIIASIVIREKTATYQTNEEKMRDKQIDQFNKLNLEQRMNWYMHVKVTLDRAYQSQSFKSVEQQMLAFVACIEQEKPLPEQTQEIMQICKIIQMGCYLTLANIYCQKQDFRKGVYYANRILEIDKYHSQAYLIRSNCYQCLGEIRAAERDMAFYAQLAEEEALMQ